MSVLYAFDFPCGCHTQEFDVREWTLCDGHSTGQEAILEWAGYGARVAKTMQELPKQPGHTHVFIDSPRAPGRA